MAEEEQVKWDRVRQNARAVNASPPEWPAHVAPISQSGLALLGLDAKHRLYWDGEPVEVGKPLVLTWWQSGLALVVRIEHRTRGLGHLLGIRLQGGREVCAARRLPSMTRDRQQSTGGGVH